MKRKKLLTLPLILALLTGCGAPAAQPASGNAGSEAASNGAETATEQASVESSDAAASTTEVSANAANDASAEASSESTADDVTAKPEPAKDKYDMRDITPTDLVAEMKTGWNLGNTFDSFGTSGVEAETYWGNPKTTKEMIDAVNEKGFDCIRIPVTWADHLGAAPDYTIDEAWFDRVEEVVNYALDDNMYVIINSHHEEEWRIPDDAHIDAVDEEVKAIWVQIANRFEKYGDHLIFEGLNEPRVKGGTNEWSGGTGEGRKCLDRLNQTFVDAVRSTGGNNEKRLVLITSFASSHVIPTIGSMKIPEDDHLAVSIHAYTPYDFTYSASGNSYDTWDGSHKGDIAGVMQDLQRIFGVKGIPVLLTEYGAEDKNGNSQEVCNWVTEYLTRAKKAGIPCFWWDNGLFESGNEHFAIFNRNDCSWYREDVADAIMAVYNEEK